MMLQQVVGASGVRRASDVERREGTRPRTASAAAAGTAAVAVDQSVMAGVGKPGTVTATGPGTTSGHTAPRNCAPVGAAVVGRVVEMDGRIRILRYEMVMMRMVVLGLKLHALDGGRLEGVAVRRGKVGWLEIAVDHRGEEEEEEEDNEDDQTNREECLLVF